MRRLVVPLILLVILLIFPFQVFVIGNDMGIGIQGAVYRFQITVYGDSLILITQDLMYIVKGTYTGKTALSVLVWAVGTILLTITTWFGLVYSDGSRTDYNQKISLGLTGSCICYLTSCIVQYGMLLHGSAGSSIPFGIGIILIWILIITFFPDFLHFTEQ